MKSIIFYSMHRSGSTAQTDILRKLASGSQYKHRFAYPEIEKFNLLEGNEVLYELPPNMRIIPENLIYGPFRRPLNIKYDNLKVVFTLRDPRDTLVSMYFSKAFSHGPPPSEKLKEKFLESRKEAIEMGIDKYVIDRSQLLLDIYQYYISIYNKCEDKALLTYEDMVLNFKKYASKLSEFCISGPCAKLNSLEKCFRPPSKENLMSHKRKLTPGDHKDKLQKNTILKLNNIFKDYFEWETNEKL